MGELSEGFKLILNNMNRDKLLNFIWMYSQYISKINEIRDNEEDWNISTENIEWFYHDLHKIEFRNNK